MPMAKEKGVQILPVDSEHSAIFQAIHGEDKREIHKLLITASGGPFRGMKASDLAHVKVEDALKHPNWAMGQKITIDSATLVNKGLEVMEAKWLFDVDLDHIQVVVQPKSIIHSMVEFVDGAVMAQLGTPDMKLPIQYALYYPHRRYLPGERLDFKTLTEITFEEPDMETFLGLPMAMEASRRGGSMPTVFNAANERAVAKFLHGQIGFLDIYRSIREAMDRHQVISKTMIFDEVALSLRNTGLDEAKVRERVEETLKICGLYPFRNWPISALSYGQKKRVTIASVLVQNPELIILDEPTAGQDFHHYTEIMEFLRKLNEEGVTVVMITHDMHLMLEYTPRALVFADGRLIADDSAAAVLCNRELVERAALKETSLFTLANRAGITPPEAFVECFIEEDREVRSHGR